MIKMLGVYGSKSQSCNPVTFQISDNIFIDAGNIINNLEDLGDVKHIIISHSHFDHIQDLPYIIDSLFPTLSEPIKIYSLKETIEYLKKHIFNNTIWPTFHEIDLISGKKAIEFETITPNKSFKIGNVEIYPFLVEHTVESLGFLINRKYLLSGDTKYSGNLVNVIKKFAPPYLFLECSFPNSMQKIAEISKHMTPNDILKIYSEIDYSPKKIFIYHMKPLFIKEIKNDFKKIDLDIFFAKENMEVNQEIKINKKIDKIIFEMIKKLYTENNINKILTKIVTYAREITNSDAATLYLKSEDDKYLEFRIIQNETLNIFINDKPNWPNLPLYKNGKPNYEMVAVLCALKGKIITIEDAYNSKRFNFEGTKKFDRMNNYRSKSMLVLPLKNHEGEIIGVLQLINKYKNNKISTYTQKDINLTYLLASIAAVTLTKNKLIEDFEKLLSSLIQTIGMAIDEKSKYTGGHVRRVAKLALEIAKAIEKEGIKKYSKDELKMIEIAGWLHDIGKITTPEYIMDKATKLSLFIDIIDYLKYKFELLKYLKKIDLLENKITKKEYEKLINLLNEGYNFLKQLNKGSEYVSSEEIEFLNKLKNIKLPNENLINELEYKNLSVRKGTLTDEERLKIQEHASIGLKMLKNLHFPKKFRKLPDIAANHHEKLNCKGYPRGLCAEQLSLEEKLMAVADIFEALSAADRPYKKPKKISEIFTILYDMVKNNEIDKNIVKLIIKYKIYEKYAKEELKKEQLDEIPKYIKAFFLKE